LHTSARVKQCLWVYEEVVVCHESENEIVSKDHSWKL
jgi:hypothetical protein